MLVQEINKINTNWKEILLKLFDNDNLNTISHHINEEKKNTNHPYSFYHKMIKYFKHFNILILIN